MSGDNGMTSIDTLSSLVASKQAKKTSKVDFKNLNDETLFLAGTEVDFTKIRGKFSSNGLKDRLNTLRRTFSPNKTKSNRNNRVSQNIAQQNSATAARASNVGAQGTATQVITQAQAGPISSGIGQSALSGSTRRALSGIFTNQDVVDIQIQATKNTLGLAAVQGSSGKKAVQQLAIDKLNNKKKAVVGDIASLTGNFSKKSQRLLNRIISDNPTVSNTNTNDATTALNKVQNTIDSIIANKEKGKKVDGFFKKVSLETLQEFSGQISTAVNSIQNIGKVKGLKNFRFDFDKGDLQEGLKVVSTILRQIDKVQKNEAKQGAAFKGLQNAINDVSAGVDTIQAEAKGNKIPGYLKNLKEDVTPIVSELNTIQAKQAGQVRSLRSLKTQAVDVSTDISDKQTIISNLEAQVSTLQTEKADLTTQLSDLSQETKEEDVFSQELQNFAQQLISSNNFSFGSFQAFSDSNFGSISNLTPSLLSGGGSTTSRLLSFGFIQDTSTSSFGGIFGGIF